MENYLLASKTTPPPIDRDLISRKRLVKSINDGVAKKLTLISAPAGFGKSSLISAWAQQNHYPTAWLSLDSNDNDSVVFLSYLVSAFNRLGIQTGINPETIVNAQHLPQNNLAENTLLNVIGAYQEKTILVLDDFQHLESAESLDLFSYLVNHLPVNLHLIIASRSDPDLPLGRMRGRGEIHEIRAGDLRFDHDEGNALFSKVFGFTLPRLDLQRLIERTEGWAAGLQMAGISMQKTEDLSDFIATFSGSHRFVVDYLMDEVLSTCSEDRKLFLLRTSFLDKFSSDLCDAALGIEDSQRLIASLEEDNLFVVPLDQERRWFRYHLLFRDLLRIRSVAVKEADLAGIQERACCWLADHGQAQEAIQLALDLQQISLAAELIEDHSRRILYRRKSRRNDLIRWFEQLPQEQYHARPTLYALRAWAMLFNTPDMELEQVFDCLDQARSTLAGMPADQVALDTVAGYQASIEALISIPPVADQPDPQKALRYLESAQEKLTAADGDLRSINYANIYYAYLDMSDSDAAVRAAKISLEEATLAGNELVRIGSLRNLAWIEYMMGNMPRSRQILDEAIAREDFRLTKRSEAIPAMALLYSLRGYLAVETGDFEAAIKDLDLSKDLNRWMRDYESKVLELHSRIRLKIMLGSPSSKEELLLPPAESWLFLDELIPQLHAKLDLHNAAPGWQQGRNLQKWLLENTFSFGEENVSAGLSIWAESKLAGALTWIEAQVRLIQTGHLADEGEIIDQCCRFIERELRFAEQAEAFSRVLELTLYLGLVHDAAGNIKGTRHNLGRALDLGESKGLVRVFLEKGPRLLDLLRSDQKIRSHPFNAKLALLMCGKDQSFPWLIEPLTKREVEVLTLISKGYSNQDISETLFLAIDTVKGHNRKIFQKLGAKNRTEAVAKATSLNILNPL